MKTPVCKQPFEIMKGKIPFKNTVQHVYEETVRCIVSIQVWFGLWTF